jgi:hypothetical protein
MLIWKITTGKLIVGFKDKLSNVHSVVWSRDGKFIVTLTYKESAGSKLSNHEFCTWEVHTQVCLNKQLCKKMCMNVLMKALLCFFI